MAYGRRARFWAPFIWATAATVLGTGCLENTSRGLDPPNDRLFFPTGLSLDPRTPADERSQFLFVANANSDLSFNGGAIQVYNLQSFLEQAGIEPIMQDGQQVPPEWAESGASLTEETPCRPSAIEPEVIECEESFFARPDDAVHTGSFTTVLRAWVPDPDKDKALFFVPVRGDPSIQWLELTGNTDLNCGEADPEESDKLRCGADFRLTNIRNEPDQATIPREPFQLEISQDPDKPFAYVTHPSGSAITMINMQGLASQDPNADPDPVIIDINGGLFLANGAVTGSYGVAQRPCDPEAAPSATFECDVVDDERVCTACERPFVYAGHRFAKLISSFTVVDIDEEDLVADPEFGYGQSCVAPDELDTPGGFICDPQVEPYALFGPGGPTLNPGLGGGGSPVLGSMRFDENGDRLFVTQTTPGALLEVDTRLDDNGEPLDVGTKAIEVCAQPSSMTLYEKGGQSFAFVSCFQVAQVFIVDLTSFQTISVVQTGIGPQEMLADPARDLVYVGNTLDGTISVIDMSPVRDSRFKEVARLGLQEPFSQ